MTLTPEARVQDALLRHRAPRSKEELWWYCKEQLRITCEVCKGAKRYADADGGDQPCEWCGGRGTHGFHIAREAVCPGHTAPLDALWEIYSGQLRQALWIAVRGGGKTRLDAVLEHLLARFKRYTISHMGAVEKQAERCRAYIEAQTGGDPEAPFAYDAQTKEPSPPGLPGPDGKARAVVPELTKDSAEAKEWANGAAIEFLPGTMAQASGPHREASILDEVDEAKPDVEQKFAKTAFGPRRIYLLTSTHTYATGTVTKIRRDQPRLPVRTWCLRGDARIATPEGEIPIRDLAGRRNVWVYTIADGKLALRRAKAIKLTRRNAPVVEVKYWWGLNPRKENSLVCTPDHKFLLLSGEWKEARDLQFGDRLEPFYRKIPATREWGIQVGRTPRAKEMVSEHRFVFEQTHRPLLPGEVVHHKNEDPWDNRPSNLQAKTDSRHKSYHQKRFAKDKVREAARVAKLSAVRKLQGAPWMRDENKRRWAALSLKERQLRSKRMSRALKGYRGWETFVAKKSPEELAQYFRVRAEKATAARRERYAKSGLTERELAGRKKAWSTTRARYLPEEIRRMKAAAAVGKSHRVKSNHKVMSVTPAGRADVFCLNVPETETFFANGVAVHNCLFEALARCTYECDAAPMPDGGFGRCPLYEDERTTADGRRELVELCGGRLARKSDGHYPVAAAIAAWFSSDPYTRRVELLCHKPELGAGAGIAYWAYAPENDLDFDPEIRPNAPLQWVMDFNPGVGMRMCSLIIQQSPEDPEEFWIVDEIVLETSSTAAVIAEFVRRYGSGGSMVPFLGQAERFQGGLWVYGDQSGNTRTSLTGETDYEYVARMLGTWPDFKLLAPRGQANPPLVDRLNVTNYVLWDQLTGKRRLKVAPRCAYCRDEFARMPLKPGSREKDKSDRIQKLGLSHLGDCAEYWVWAHFGDAIPTGARMGVVAVGRRDSSAGAPGSRTLLVGGGRRASAGLGRLPRHGRTWDDKG